jgi:hypothetical protein
MFANSALDYLIFIDMHMHNVGANRILLLDNYIQCINCEFDNASSHGLDLDDGCLVFNCHFHNITNSGCLVQAGGLVAFNTFENGTNDFNEAIAFPGRGSTALFNVIDIDGSSQGIDVTGDNNSVLNNSIYSAGGTGQGVIVAVGGQMVTVVGNICEGFSGVGGKGIELVAGSNILLYGFNAFYNNTTNLDNSGDVHIDLSANDQNLTPGGVSPFTDAANDDFTVSTLVKALAYPTGNYPSLAVRTFLDIGALQRVEAGGGAGPVIGGFILRG